MRYIPFGGDWLEIPGGGSDVIGRAQSSPEEAMNICLEYLGRENAGDHDWAHVLDVETLVIQNSNGSIEEPHDLDWNAK